MRKYKQGFTLIELMITVAIVAIIAAIAYPSYRAQIRKSNRSMGRVALLANAQTLERCFTQASSYVDVSCVITANSSSFDSGRALYAIAFTANPAPTATTFTLEATAQGSQIDDTACAKMQLSSTGAQTALTSANVANDNACWR